METNNIMNEGMDVMIEEFVADEVVNTGIGMNKYTKGGLVIAGLAAVALLAKKGYDMYKAKKELHKPEHDITVEDAELEEVVEPEA